MSTLSIAERVAAGVAWLDETTPDWPDHVNVLELDMALSCRCVLGQLYGDYVEAPLPLRDRLAFGFDVSNEATATSLRRVEKEYAELRAEWTRVIQERRAQTAGETP